MKRIIHLIILLILSTAAYSQCPSSSPSDGDICEEGKGIRTDPDNPINLEAPAVDHWRLNDFDWKIQNPQPIQFAEDYKLRSIEEVASFIDKNKHLPDVPSEAEVLENGLDLAEMQSIPQQQIEELTLYIIQQQKQIDLLMQTVTQLTK